MHLQTALSSAAPPGPERAGRAGPPQHRLGQTGGLTPCFVVRPGHCADPEPTRVRAQFVRTA